MKKNNISNKEIYMITVGTIMTLVVASIFVPILLVLAGAYILNEMSEGNDGFSEGIDEWTKQLNEEGDL